MSTVAEKRSLSEACQDALDFQALFPMPLITRWHVAGSVRREKPFVGDVEHVVVPVNVEAFWRHLESLVSDPNDMFSGNGPLTKHVYPNGSLRWGEKYRGVDFRGFNHEIFLADKDNLGAILAIRTGPADYSKMLVTAMLNGGRYRQQGGYVVCRETGEIRSVPEENNFFAACGVPYIAPQKRV